MRAPAGGRCSGGLWSVEWISPAWLSDRQRWHSPCEGQSDPGYNNHMSAYISLTVKQMMTQGQKFQELLSICL